MESIRDCEHKIEMYVFQQVQIQTALFILTMHNLPGSQLVMWLT